MRVRIPRRKPKPAGAELDRRVARRCNWYIRAAVIVFDADAVWVFVSHVLLNQPLYWWTTSIFCACFVMIGYSLWKMTSTMNALISINDDLLYDNICLLNMMRRDGDA